MDASPAAPGGPIPQRPIVGCDPGLHGAFAIYDPWRNTLALYDMPIYPRGAGRRTGIDPQGILKLMQYFQLWDVQLCVVEQIGRRPHESASAATTAGYGSGLIEMAALAVGLPVERPAANVWKARMRCPADKWGAIQRADQLWPQSYHDFRGERGGERSGRAEAALLARFGAENYLGLFRRG